MNVAVITLITGLAPTPQLEKLGFEVELLPLLPLRSAFNGWEEHDYALTWNNVVLESYRGESGTDARTVLLPTYADPEDAEPESRLQDEYGPAIRRELDTAAAELWEKLQFLVHRIEQTEDLAYGGGSLHCITKVLQRSPGDLQA